MKRAAAITLFISTLCQSCVTAPVDPAQRAAAEQRMKTIYECVWFEYLTDNKDRGNELIDLAIKVANKGGVPDEEIMVIYGSAQAAQKEKILPLAQSYALEARPPKVESIMGETQVEPNEDEVHRALVDTYRDQCENSDL